MRFKGLAVPRALLLGATTLGLTACGGGGDSARVAQTVDAGKNGIVRVELEDNEGYAHYQGRLQLNLIGRNSENVATNLNSKATWKLSDASLGSINNGLFTPSGKVGELIITVDYAGLSDTQNVIVSDANLVSLTVNPVAAPIDECQNATLTANAVFDNGLTLDYDLNWAVTEGASLASFSDVSSGTLSTKNSGAVTVVVSANNNDGEKVSSTPVTINIADSLRSLTLTSNKAAEMREGDSATVSIKGTYANNASLALPNASLTATPSSSLTIEGTKITAKNGTYAGTDVELVASCGGESDSLDLVILKKELKSIEIKNSNGGTDNLSVTEGSNLELNVTATFADNATDSNYDYNLNWSIVDSKSDDFDDDLITLDQTGKLSVSSDLDLALNQQLRLVVRAEVRDEDNRIATNAQGQQLVDEINIVVRP
uniref:hypothetical protein n=1 Tax=Cellvibrio fontiphilus TaxID=1815559 RepID=UPI002B4C0196|nr:hypothetical protein [Cellvibrio fontiphilus]